MEGGAVAAALDGGGAAALRGQEGGRGRDMPGGWRNTVGMCIGHGGLDEEEGGGWFGGAIVAVDDCGGGWVRREVRLLKAGSLWAETVHSKDNLGYFLLFIIHTHKIRRDTFELAQHHNPRLDPQRPP